MTVSPNHDHTVDPTDPPILAGQEPAANQIVVTAIIFEGGLGVLAIAIGWLLSLPVVEPIRWDANAVWCAVLATLPMVAMLLLIERWPVGPFRALKKLVDESLVPMFAGCRWWHFAVISALAGFGEELLFRGLIQASLVDWLGMWPAIIVAAILFGLAHPLSKTYIAAAAAIGVYLGWLFVVSGNLLVPILIHALYDFVALLYLTHGSNNRY